MKIQQSEIDEAFDKYNEDFFGSEEYFKEYSGDDWKLAKHDFKTGVEFAQSKFQDFFMEIITENQGLKLYKDNEPKRFEELATEFLKWFDEVYLNERVDGTRKEKIPDNVLFKQFLKETRNE